MISLMRITRSVYDAVNGICDRTFIEDRPKSVITSLDSYIVIKIVSSVRNNEIGENGEYGYYNGTFQIEVYVRDVVTASNPAQIDINGMDSMVTDVLELFPIKDEHVHLMRPAITLSMADGNGFHCTIIQALFTTLV